MFAAYPGDVIFSKIDARNGAIGTLPSAIDKAVVTAEFPVFTADPARLDVEFVQSVLRTGGFIEALRRRASGTSGRKRITPDAFRDLRIPLPPLDEQRAIVAAHRAALDHAAKLDREADELETQAMAAFEAALGFEPAVPLPERPVFVASFKDLDRWSHEAALRRAVGGNSAHPSPYPIVRLGDVIVDLENGWSPKCHNRPAAGEEWGVLKVSAVSSGEYRETENKALPTQLQPKPGLQVQSGDILITRASGAAQLVGVSTLVESTRRKLMICDKIFRIIGLDKKISEASFFAHVLGIHSVRAQIEREFSTNSGMMKNVSKPVLMSLSFPLPPKNEQIDMTSALNDGRARATSLCKRAEEARTNAWTGFQTAIYAAEEDSAAADVWVRQDSATITPNA